MKVQLIKQGSGLWKPASQEDLDALKKYPVFHKMQFDMKEADRSIQEHRMFWQFFNFLFENQSYEANKDKFRAMLLLTLGHTEISYKRLGKGKYEEIEIPRSLRFDKMSQKDFHNLFKDVQDFAKDKMGISFDEWKENEIGFDGKCANPDCNNIATDIHEIIMGNYRRQFCIDKGLQVKICRECHSIAHGKKENIEAGYMSLDMWNMFKIFCGVLKVDPEKLRNYIEKPTDQEIPWE